MGARFIEAGWQVYYWKDRDFEVDFVVLGPQGQKWAIEVKSGHYENSDLKGIRKFCSLHPEFSPRVLSLINQPSTDAPSLPAETVLSLCREMRL